MNYSGIVRADIANGEGVRLSLFVSGCTNHCPGCFNKQTWDFDSGNPWTDEEQEKFLKELGRPFYDGITVLGGEPFELQNQEAVYRLMKAAKDLYPEKTIWAYTGNVYDRDLIPGGKRHGAYTDRILNLVDVLVDGPFVLDEKDITLQYKGSRNQRVIDMHATRESGQVTLSRWN